MYYVLGIEPFKQAQVKGVHSNKKTAEQQAIFRKTKSSMLSKVWSYNSDRSKRKYELFAWNDDLIQYNRNRVKMIFKVSKTYQIITEESAEYGDYEEQGFIYEDQEFIWET